MASEICAWGRREGEESSLARERSGLLEVVGAEGPHVPQALLLHHPDGLLLGQLQKGVVDLAHVIMEGDVPESGIGS